MHVLILQPIEIFGSLQLTASYKDRRKVVDELKEQLQKRINEYSKLSEDGNYSGCFSREIVVHVQ